MGDEQQMTVFVFLLTVFCCLGGCGTGGCVVRHIERTSAIEAGAAEWRIDAKTGTAEFVYLSPGKCDDKQEPTP